MCRGNIFLISLSDKTEKWFLYDNSLRHEIVKFKTTGWLQGHLSLSSFWYWPNEYQSTSKLSPRSGSYSLEAVAPLPQKRVIKIYIYIYIYGGGWASNQIFKKGGLDRTSTFRAVLLGKRGSVCNCHIETN